VTFTTSRGAGTPPLRADAARNRAQVLAAARAAFRELGTAAPLDEIARRAGVNIATLYRRFPDRDALIRQVVVDGFALVLESIQQALAVVSGDALSAIEGFLIHMVEERDMLALPLIGGPVTDDREAVELRGQIVSSLEEILEVARAQEAIRHDVTAVDLIATGVMACRPMPHLPAAQATALAVRHVRVFVDGLRPAGARPLPAAPTPDEIFIHVDVAGSRDD